MPRARSAALDGLRLGAWSGLLLGAALAGACFDAPQPAVQFSCDPADAPECPPGYTCEADGCCHLDGSDYAAHEGDCQLGGAALTGGPVATTGSGSGDSSSGDGPTTEAPVTTGTDGSTDDSESGSTAGTSGSGGSDSTAGTGESSGTGT